MTRDTSWIITEITPCKLSLENLVRKVEDSSAGAVATFSGVTRDHFDGKTVEKLEYEAYEPMAKKKLQESLTSALKALLTYAWVSWYSSRSATCRRSAYHVWTSMP